MILAIHHIQIAMPPGREHEARSFYEGLLGIPEQPKPPHLAARGGCWFERGSVKVHLGVEQDFMPARKAHPAFLVANLPELTQRLASAGHSILEDQPLSGFNRVYVHDPFGNRIELMETPYAANP